MKSTSILVLAMVVLLCGFAPISFATTASFQGLGDLQGGGFYSYAYGVSDDASTVVGRGYSGYYEAVRWTESTGMVSLGDLSGGEIGSEAYGVSQDGSVVVGYGRSASGFEACRWTESAGMVGLGDLPGGIFHSEAEDVSANGLVVVGWGDVASGCEPFRWTESTGMVGLGHLAGYNSSSAYGVSADGLVIVGTSSNGTTSQAFRWSESTGMVGLGDLPGGRFLSEAYDVSANGLVIVGGSENNFGLSEAFRWTEETGMVGLGYFPEGMDSWSRANGVSADGSVVIGQSISIEEEVPRNVPFIWDDENGFRSLRSVFENEFGLDLAGWTLDNATGISADGLTIVGYGINPDGHREAWVATIPPPTIKVAVDIKPQSCPNPLDVKSKGVLPVAILGTEDVNVIDIVIASIRLADPNVAPIRNSYEDVAGPVFDANDCNCTTDGPDGFLDLTLKFETQRIVEAIGEVNDGDVLTLELTGVLFDPIPFETPIEGADCILIRGRHKPFNKADINKDGVVDTVDFAIFSENWLQSSIVED